MARLTEEQWKKARAEYEVRGISLQQVADMFRVVRSSVSKKAAKEGWQQGKDAAGIEKKVEAVKNLALLEQETADLPMEHKAVLENAVSQRLQAEGLLATFDCTLLQKGITLAQAVQTPDQWMIMTQGRRNMAPGTERPTTSVVVNQSANAQAAALPPPSPEPADALRRVLRGDLVGDD